jgi:hypothetical protein
MARADRGDMTFRRGGRGQHGDKDTLRNWRNFLVPERKALEQVRPIETAGFLRSLGITPVRYFEPFRHLLAFLPFPGETQYTLLLIPTFHVRGRRKLASPRQRQQRSLLRFS